MKLICMILSIILFFAFDLSATAQIGDILLHDGTENHVNGFKLSSSLREAIKKIKSQTNFMHRSTANWDGYTAKLTLLNGKLYLTNLYIDDSVKGSAINLKQIEPFKAGPPIFANWFDGTLRDYFSEHEAKFFGGTFKHYIFKSGILVETQEVLFNKID